MAPSTMSDTRHKPDVEGRGVYGAFTIREHRGTCTCGWRGGWRKRQRQAAIEANRHAATTNALAMPERARTRKL